MSLPPDAIATLLSGDPELVLQAILQTYPDQAVEILDAVARLGLERAIQVILGQQQEGPTPGSASLPEIAATGTTPQVSKAVRGVSNTLSDMPQATRKPSETGVGARSQINVTTSNVNEPDLSIPSPDIPITPRSVQNVPPGGINDSNLQPLADTKTVQNADPFLAMSMLNPLDIIKMPTIVTEPYDSFLKGFQKVCADNKIPMPVALAIIKQESQFNPTIESSAGAVGLMQLLPGTARQVGLQVSTQKDERTEPRKNINGGLKYLKWIQTTHKTTTLDEMLAGYNAGPSRIKNNKWKKIRETVDYVEIVKRSVKAYEKDPETMLEDLKKLHSVIGE